MKTIFRIKHARGRGFVDFDDYGPLLSIRGQHSEWNFFVLTVNHHGLVLSERELKSEELNSDRLWFIKRGVE